MTLAKSSIKNIVLFLTSFSVLVLNGCDQHTTSREAIKVLPPPLPTKIKQTNFDIKAEKLAKDFQSHDVWEVIKSIRALPTKQDKFEKSSDYFARMNALSESVLFDDVKLNGYFAFKISSNLAHLSYNADKEEFSYQIHIYEHGITFDEKPVYRGDDGVPLSGYDSPDSIDAYFIKEQFKKVTYQRDASVTLKSFTYGDYIGKFKASPAQAKSLDDRVSFFLIGKILQPYLRTNSKFPFDYDQKVFKYQNELPFQLDGIWVVNNETGEILIKKALYKSH